jgi:hypothetical protein
LATIGELALFQVVSEVDGYFKFVLSESEHESLWPSYVFYKCCMLLVVVKFGVAETNSNHVRGLKLMK